MNEILTISRQVVNDMLTQAQKSPDAEICGLVAGHENHGQHIYPIRNIAESATTRYHLDPKEQIDAMRHIRDNQQSLIAIYHSHPSSAALPSATDLDEASYPDAIYLIISLNTIGVLELSAFKISDKSYKSIELKLE